MILKQFTIASLLIILSACSQQIYQGRGQYTDSTDTQREILLQWKAQTYHLPFMSNEVDYGSVSLQVTCLKGGLLDYENHPQLGLVFKERSQKFTLANNENRINVGNFIVCAKLQNNKSLAELNPGDDVMLETYCTAKNQNNPIIEARPKGYLLSINASDSEDTIDCRHD